MELKIQKINRDLFPTGLLEIPDVPELLHVVGAPLDTDALYLSVVGSRTHTSYGRDACDKLIKGLAGSNIVIVSGLALGIDSIAHRAAMSAGLKTVAFPGSGLSERAIYPATNLGLAKEILATGGTLVSEFEPDFRATQWSFPRRNRLVAGIAHAVLVVEAPAKSGALITARLALDYNRDVLSVPGPITSLTSFGTNLLLRQGATPILTSDDILEVFGLTRDQRIAQKEEVENCSPEEKNILEILLEPCSRDELIETLDGKPSEVNTLLSIMEIKGLIKEELGEIRRV